MAATQSPSKLKHSRFLFVHENGNPMIFYMRPCAERSFLKPDIEHGGGEVTAKVVKDSIKLAGDGDYTSTDDYYSTRFIKDCVQANKILDIETYRLKIRKSIRSQMDSAEEDVVSDISDDESDLTRIYRTKLRDIKGRMSFTTEEDTAMLKYIIDNGRVKDIQGKALYREMELKQVTTHSAESMSCRFRKVIMPNLDKYKIDNSWKHKLTGDPKYSASTAKVTHLNTLSDRVPVVSCDADSTKTGLKSPPSKDSDSNSVKKSQNNKQSDSDSPVKETTLKVTDWISKRDRVKSLRLTRRKSELSSKERENDTSDVEMTDEDSFDLALLKSANLRKNTHGHSSPGGKNLRSAEKTNASSAKSSPKQRQTVTSRGDNLTNNDWNEKSKKLHSESKNNNENIEEIKKNNAMSPVVRCQILNIVRQKELVESSKRSSEDSNMKNGASTSPKRRKNQTENITGSEEAGPSGVSRKVSLSPSKITTNTQKKCLSPPKTTSSPQKKSSSHNKTTLNSQKKSDSSPKMSSPQVKTNAKSNSKSPSPSKRQRYLRSRVDYIMDTNDIESTEGSQSQSSQPETVIENGREDTDDENAKEVLKFIHKISARYNLTHNESYHCLWINNGSFDDAISWIETGVNCDGLPPWDQSDDEALNSADGIKRLTVKYGIDAVHERQYFLEL